MGGRYAFATQHGVGVKMRALVVCLVAGGIAGCSGSKSDKEQKKPAAAPARSVNINVATATTGGAYYPIGNAIAQLWNDKLPQVRASAQADRKSTRLNSSH